MGFIRDNVSLLSPFVLPAYLLGGMILSYVTSEHVGEFWVRRNDERTQICTTRGMHEMCWVDENNDGRVDVKYTLSPPGRFLPSIPLYQTIGLKDHMLLEDVVGELDKINNI